MDTTNKIGSPLLWSLVRIWAGARADGQIPRKSSIDPIDLGHAGLLPYIWIARRHGNGQFVYQLAGEEIHLSHGVPLKGRSLFELYDAKNAQMVQDRWQEVLDREIASHSSGEVYSRAGRIFQGERLVLPLRDDQDGLNFIIGATVRTERIPDINEDHAEAFGPQQMAFIPLDVLTEESD